MSRRHGSSARPAAAGTRTAAWPQLAWAELLFGDPPLQHPQTSLSTRALQSAGSRVAVVVRRSQAQHDVAVITHAVRPALGSPSDDDMSSTGSSTSACRSCATARRLRARIGFCSAAGRAARRASAAVFASLVGVSPGCLDKFDLPLGCAGDPSQSSSSLSSLRVICARDMNGQPTEATLTVASGPLLSWLTAKRTTSAGFVLRCVMFGF
jgi:hypothetical protein